MFTGLVQSLGTISARIGRKLSVSYLSTAWSEAFELGESVAVNGCCLTVVADQDYVLEFDVSDETWNRTSLGELAYGDSVNLERAMRPIDRFGGHIVQGHVDATGAVISVVPNGSGAVITFKAPEDGGKYLIDKGSIAIDGISLTVVSPRGDEFDVWVIPHTLAHTNLGALSPGDHVNLEYDVLAKHVEKLLSAR